MTQIISVILSTAAIFFAIMLHLAVRPQVSRKLIGFAVSFTAVGGLLVYGYGYACAESSGILAVIRATFAVCSIFVGGNALDDIQMAPAFQYTAFQIFFWLLHLMGLFGSTGAVITALGSRVLRQLRLWLIRSRDIAVIYSLTPQTLAFGRELTENSRISLVYVDPDPAGSLSATVDHMGCILRSDADALNAATGFLKSMGLRSGKRRVWLYALSADLVANQKYAAHFLKSLEDRSISPEQTALTIRGPEDETDNRFLNRENRYGYGSVISLNEPEMVARLLVQHYPPCDTLTFDETGCANADFHGLIIGFGQVGQAVLRQLTMNGQFQGSHFRISVFDPDYEQVMGRLSSECESLLQQYDITFHPHDGRSRELYRYLTQNAGNLRYIALCTGSDALNQEIAGEVQPFLNRRGNPVPIYQCSHKGIRHQASEDRMVTLEIYTRQLLCSDRMDRMAMVLNQTYCGSGTARENWITCDYFSRMSSRASADFVPALLRCAGVTQEEALKNWAPEGQLMENLAKTEHLRWNAFHHCMGFRAMTKAEFEERAAIYRSEVAAKGSSRFRVAKDLNQRIHACLVSWEELEELSAREYTATGRTVDYQEMDRNNVRSIPGVLQAMKDAK